MNDDDASLANIDDYLEQLGIVDEETYHRKDIERVYKAMQFDVT